MEVLLGGRRNYMIMVRHEDNVMDKNVIFFNAFSEGFEKYPGDLPLVEPERSIIGSADQVIWIDILYDSQWASHAGINASMLPSYPKVL